MKIFEFFPMRIVEKRGEGNQQLLDDWVFAIDNSDEAEDLLVPIFRKHNLHWFDFLTDIISTYTPPWVITCLSEEYDIAGHIAKTRKPDSKINLSPYSILPEQLPEGYVPRVGIVTFYSRKGLEDAAGISPFFLFLWEAFKDCDPYRHWLVILEPLQKDLLDQITPGDRENWLSSR